jgi:hypothetical protein
MQRNELILWAVGIVAGLLGLALIVLGFVSAFGAGTQIQLGGTGARVLLYSATFAGLAACWLVVLAGLWWLNRRLQETVERLRNPPAPSAFGKYPTAAPEYAPFVVASAAVPIGVMSQQLDQSVTASLLYGFVAAVASVLATIVLKKWPLLGILAFAVLAVGCLTVAIRASADPRGWLAATTATDRVILVTLVLLLVGIPALVAWFELQRPTNQWQFRRRFNELLRRQN